MPRDERLTRPRHYTDAPKPCPLEHLHTEKPKTSFQQALWAVNMIKTHRQVMCDGCKQYVIWVKR